MENSKFDLNANHPMLYLLLTTLLFPFLVAILHSELSSILYQRGMNISQHNNLVESIQKISIGSNKEWFDQNMGVPTYISSEEDLSDCIYVNEVAIVRVFFDDNECCKAFFVTLPETGTEEYLSYPELYNWVTASKKLGEVSYYDTVGSPDRIGGNVTQGFPHVCYVEQNYYVSKGNYYDFYFCSLDYGKKYIDNNPLEDLVPSKKWSGDDEVNQRQLCSPYQSWAISNRNKGKPNTYGISSISNDVIFDILLKPSMFDVRMFYLNNQDDTASLKGTFQKIHPRIL